MSFEINIFVNKIQRLPLSKVQEMLKKHDKEIEELPFMDSLAILNFVEKRFNIAKQISKTEIMFQMMLFKDLASDNKSYRNPEVEESAKNELSNLNLMALIE